MTEKTKGPQWELTWRNLDTGEIATFKSDENGVIHIPAGNYAPTQRFPPLHSPKRLGDQPQDTAVHPDIPHKSA